MSDFPTEASLSQAVWERLESLTAPLLRQLDAHLDKRLVRTFLLALRAIVTLRHTRYGLLLSELGAFILSPAQAPAGTKRLSNLLRSPKWSHSLGSDFLWSQATARLETLAAARQPALAIWDESVLEKPESLALEGLGPVRSSKAARLQRVKPGYFHPPGGGPVFVPGMQWLSLMVAGRQGPPVLAVMRWWTSRGPLASQRRVQEGQLLRQCAAAWGSQALHVWDRGFASAAWLGEALALQARFILRWPGRYTLVDAQGQRNAWRLVQGKRSQDHRLLWDASRRCFRRTGIITVPARHPQYQQPLTLVVARPGQGRPPWYLLTNEPLDDLEAAWGVVLAYARRWQIEMSYHYGKTELAMESPRLWRWENRVKLLMLVSLAYAFLLTLATAEPALAAELLRRWCHRTGKGQRQTALPHRLRSALSRLWLAYPPSPLALNSG